MLVNWLSLFCNTGGAAPWFWFGFCSVASSNGPESCTRQPLILQYLRQKKHKTSNDAREPTQPMTRKATILGLQPSLLEPSCGGGEGGDTGGRDGRVLVSQCWHIYPWPQIVPEYGNGPQGHSFLQGPGRTSSKTA
ncbi:hypothetical protein HS088_TW18G00231 [Tripterygium wilfordii]|uniref:Secreted protein n=1 Tax=Tripterygium wilfordii TaxID=458696 RepID=A0A7J7CBK4_TRIWF|nr:hypothetical protein HS088_TW18G00231 [Tripterygium wilfordii]